MGGPPIVRLLEARSEGAADYGRWGIRLPGSLGHTCPMTDPVLDSPPMRAPILPRTGIGTDVHAFTDPHSTDPLHLACPTVVAHACCDALFSAAGLGDLGSNFGTAEPRWRGAAGGVLLAEAARRVRAAGYEIGNIAVQLVGARPRVAGRVGEASAALSAAVGADVAFSATTTDHLGFLGREEGLLAIATALVYSVPAL